MQEGVTDLIVTNDHLCDELYLLEGVIIATA